MSSSSATNTTMTTHLLHGLWRPASGLHLWIEQIDGHKILLPESVPEGVFPDALQHLLRNEKFRHPVPITLLTPKGKQVLLTVPTAAFTPEQAVRVLSLIAGLNPHSASQAQRASIAPDLLWLAGMYQGLTAFVRAGRLVFKLAYQDRQWWPMWQLSAGLEERGWIAQMTAAAPGILIQNAGSDITQSIADELPHWIANHLLEDVLKRPRHAPLHEFTKNLLASEPLRRGSAGLVSALNLWRSSVNTVTVQVQVVVEDPDNQVEDANEALWPVRFQVCVGEQNPVPLDAQRLGTEVFSQALEVYQQIIQTAPLLDAPEARADVPDTSPEQVALRVQREMLWQHPECTKFDRFLSTDELLAFIEVSIPALRARGIVVMLPKSWGRQETTARIRVGDPADSSTEVKLGLEQIVDYNWEISIGDTKLTPEEMQQLVHSKSGLIKLHDQWVLADQKTVHRVSQYMKHLAEGSRQRRLQELETAQMRAQLAQANNAPDAGELQAYAAEIAEKFAADFSDAGTITLGELRALALEQAEDDPIAYEGSPWYESMLGGGEQAAALPAPERIPMPDTVHAELRDYQRRGVDWLHWMARQRLGAVLADDMGLGKTLQVLALEAVERQAPQAPSLVIAPTSVVGNWLREAQRFVPGLRVVVHHGSQRPQAEAFIDQARDVDLVITSYGTAARDYALLAQIKWRRVVLDEAQQVKNTATKVAKAVRAIPCEHRIALSGTPVENRLSEMRAILDFCNPGVLGSASFFRNHFARAIEREQDEVKIERLRAFTAPFILRRLKTDPAIIDDLPNKSEQILRVALTSEQAALYAAFVEQLNTQLQQASGIAKRGLVLASLTKIKQICNHPTHFLQDGSAVTVNGKHRSGKVAALMELLQSAMQAEQRVLIFTQYRAFGEILQPYLSDFFGTEIPFLHGGVSKNKRDVMVERFQSPDGPPAMVLSLKAGGTGLNLTNASVVVHMDRWWNPAVENQATDRAYRIGQRKDVTVYKMITTGTIEESIQDILDGKTQLASTIVGEGEGWITELSAEELAMLFSYRGAES